MLLSLEILWTRPLLCVNCAINIQVSNMSRFSCLCKIPFNGMITTIPIQSKRDINASCLALYELAKRSPKAVQWILKKYNNRFESISQERVTKVGLARTSVSGNGETMNGSKPPQEYQVFSNSSKTLNGQLIPEAPDENYFYSNFRIRNWPKVIS